MERAGLTGTPSARGKVDQLAVTPSACTSNDRFTDKIQRWHQCKPRPSGKRVRETGVSNQEGQGFSGTLDAVPLDPPVNPPAAFVKTGALVGYGRVSTREQNLARQ
jgi:hypothetical protein